MHMIYHNVEFYYLEWMKGMNIVEPLIDILAWLGNGLSFWNDYYIWINEVFSFINNNNNNNY